MCDNIPCLEILPIWRYLEHKILRKTFSIVSKMQPGKKHLVVLVIFIIAFHITIICPVFLQPPNTGLHYILDSWRIADTRITFHIIRGTNIPGVFKKSNMLILFLPLVGKQVTVEGT